MTRYSRRFRTAADAYSALKADEPTGSASVPQAHGTATEPQLAYIGGLLGEREFNSPEQEANFMTRYGQLAGAGELSKAKASEIITFLLARPKKAQALPTSGEPRDIVGDTVEEKVPAGRYAVTGDDSVTRFYRVDKPTEGRWAGRTFVKVQASDELHPVRDRSARLRILAAIAVDPAAASKLYGREIGSCGVCGRTLTDETSRANGIGPICAANTGW